MSAPVRCEGCGCDWTDRDLATRKIYDPQIISCCPERNPLNIDQWRERALAAEAKLRALDRDR